MLYYDLHMQSQLCRERAEELARAARSTRMPTGSDSHRRRHTRTPLGHLRRRLRDLRGSEPDRAPAYRAP